MYNIRFPWNRLWHCPNNYPADTLSHVREHCLGSPVIHASNGLWFQHSTNRKILPWKRFSNIANGHRSSSIAIFKVVCDGSFPSVVSKVSEVVKPLNRKNVTCVAYVNTIEKCAAIWSSKYYVIIWNAMCMCGSTVLDNCPTLDGKRRVT